MQLNKLSKKVFPIILAGFLLAQPFSALVLINTANAETCADECAHVGQTETSGDYYRVCGNYDSDCCYEWSQWYQNEPTCADECAYVGETKCYDSTHTQTCGDYDSDCCYEWSSAQSCGSDQVCQNGTCVTQETNDPVTGSLSVSSYSVCLGESIAVTLTGQDDDGLVQLKLMIDDGEDSYVFDCSDAQDCAHIWNITKSIPGTHKLTAKFFGEKPDGTTEVYSIDDIYIEFKECFVNNPPVANAGPDKEIFETESVILQGSGSDPDEDSVSYSWTCDGGTLSNSDIAQPIFYAPIVSSDTNYTCTLTVTDSHNASDSDSMNILVKEHHCLTLSVSLAANPNSGCSPLNNIDLTSSVSGSASGETTYFFDCTNDGVWERTITSNNSVYTASDICNYPSAGTYTARARVQREGLSAENTTQVNVQSCYNAPSVNIKANGSDGPITISHNSSANLTWTSENVDSCYASNAWSGSKSTSGSQSTGNLTYSKTYNITCSGSGGSVSDSVIVNVSTYSNNPPVADAGSDKTVYENETMTLDGSGYDPDGGSVTYYWTCNGGYLNYRYTARPVFDAPLVSYNRNYTCTLTVTDDDGYTDSDNMIVSVRDRSRDNENVELKITEVVKNVSDGDTIWYNSLYADPGDKLLFKITVKSTSDAEARNVRVKNILPSKIVYKDNLRIDNVYSSANINTDSINIGDISPNQTVVITFEGEVKSKSNFNYGTTNLISSVTASNSDDSDTDTCKIMVRKKSVAGVTNIRTGIDNKLFSSLLFPLGIAILMIVIFKSQFIGFDKWLENRKKQTQEYRNKRLLKKEITDLNI